MRFEYKKIYKMSIEVDRNLILNKLMSTYNCENDAAFASFLEIKPTTLSSWRSRNTFNIDLIYSKCVGVSGDFLISGEGNVKRSGLNFVQEEAAVFPLKTDRRLKSQIIPLYDIQASAGIVTLFSDTTKTNPIDFIQVPGLPKCDGAVKVNGDSMYPLLKSGDIVMYKQIHNIKDGIYWGEMYLISIDQDGDDLVTVKYIQKSEKGENYIKLVSQNSHHQERDVQLKKVRALALIKASIRINSMS